VRAHEHAFERLVGAGIDLLMRHVRRHIDEIAGAGLGDEFQILAPAHARLAAQNVDHAFQCAVMMRSGFGVGLNGDGSGPDLLRANARIVDRRLAVHAGRLRGVGIERVAGNDAHAVMFPFRRMVVIVRMVVAHRRRPYCPRLLVLAKRRASSAARKRALALFTHSCCSACGLLSATMPAPACTYMVPFFTSAVRSTMQVSMSPAAEK